ncbi:adenosylmethionine decarboxylase [Glaciecola sp. MH2013]|uniref:adenosylmethionine decarboxylase n=1 Tax=Glaciecola sp. MH2013 TaxID=2785524 RepID=UPI00189CCE55|nr:adenosylmethionine decarboxylase [Glaciecola sp. MH2013]MBF7073635.1 adenosylmethionine decarboxylase [Glaciecola sp. MH2013]
MSKSVHVTASNYAPGRHILLDLYDGRDFTNSSSIELALKNAATACKATILNIHLHSFGENAGITGIALLAESHISIHTWPERAYAAIDIFMCGDCEPENALPSLLAHFRPAQHEIVVHRRGDARSHEQNKAKSPKLPPHLFDAKSC